MKQLCTFSIFILSIFFIKAQNVGIGTTTPLTKLHVESSSANTAIATFNGGPGMWINIAENGSNRGYIGSYTGNAEDVDFGTYSGNTTGKLHLTTNNTPRLTILNSGNIGIGTTTPEQLFSVAGGMVIDQSNLNNGTSGTMLHFGSSSGEGIGSRRTAGANQYAIDFYTQNINRMTVTNGGNVGIGLINPSTKLEIRGALGFSSTTKRWEMNYDSTAGYFYFDEYGSSRRLVIKDGGNVGIGTIAPLAPLDIAVGNNRHLLFKNDLIPTIEASSTSAGDGLAGIMRLKNAIEIHPNSSATNAGKLDVRDISGNPTITLDGGTGFISAGNLPAFAWDRDSVHLTLSTGSQNIDAVLCELLINVPGPGQLYIEGSTEGFLSRPIPGTDLTTIHMEMKIDEYTPGGSYITTLQKRNLGDRDYSDPVVHTTRAVTAAGQKRYKLVLYKNGTGPGATTILYHYLKIWYFPAVNLMNAD